MTRSSGFPGWEGRMVPTEVITPRVPVQTNGTYAAGGDYFQGVELSDGRWLCIWSEDDGTYQYLQQGYIPDWDTLATVDDSVEVADRELLLQSAATANRYVRGSVCWGPDDNLWMCVIARDTDLGGTGLTEGTIVSGTNPTRRISVMLYRSFDEGGSWEFVVEMDGFNWTNAANFGEAFTAGEMVEHPADPTVWIYPAPNIRTVVGGAAIVAFAPWVSVDGGLNWVQGVDFGTANANQGGRNFGWSGARSWWEFTSDSASGSGNRFVGSADGSTWVNENAPDELERCGVPLSGGRVHRWFNRDGAWYQLPTELTATPVADNIWPDDLVLEIDAWAVNTDNCFLVKSQDGKRLAVWFDDGVLAWRNSAGIKLGSLALTSTDL